MVSLGSQLSKALELPRLHMSEGLRASCSAAWELADQLMPDCSVGSVVLIMTQLTKDSLVLEP